MPNLNDIQIPASRTYLIEQDYIPSRVWFRFFESIYRYSQKGFGSFYDDSSQTASSNTPVAVTFTYSETARSIFLGTPSSRIIISRDGVYNITTSLQFINTSTSVIDTVLVWLKINNVNLNNSTKRFSLPIKSSGIDNKTLYNANWFINITPRDYIEVYWMTLNGTTSLASFPASVSPSYPLTPSAYITLDQVI